jgi:predicted transporter
MTSGMEKATPTIVGCLLVGSGSEIMKCIQCGSDSATMSLYIVALPLPTTIGDVAFSISEIVY